MSAQSWKTVSTSLVVTRPSLDPQSVSDMLDLPQAGSINESGAGVVSQSGWWALVHPGSDSPHLEQQLQSLAGQIQPRSTKVRELISLGYSVHIDISGVAETGDTLFISPAAQRHLAVMALPVRCTVISPAGEPASDPLDWLD
ncbi:hypothetical protein [Streptomyces xanthochromogenes]|uniref:Uncharacterized protein n=1 Tax=Streptomyces xanthochromogenes TaxID=67384 RepID=A0ABQ3AWS9_9ACTN|nr:hypothetical protein [Streptomyces xanthochromogenes]GGY70231.1 hypothetical protein GCM10010326_75620 [Streptomyces xanthochromogenes]